MSAIFQWQFVKCDVIYCDEMKNKCIAMTMGVHNLTISRFFYAISKHYTVTHNESNQKIKLNLPETPLQFPFISVEQKLSSALTVTKMATITYNHFIFSEI